MSAVAFAVLAGLAAAYAACWLAFAFFALGHASAFFCTREYKRSADADVAKARDKAYRDHLVALDERGEKARQARESGPPRRTHDEQAVDFKRSIDVLGMSEAQAAELREEEARRTRPAR